MKRKVDQPENNKNSTDNKRAKTFNNFYEKNVNWMDDSDINPIATLQSFYPIYFQGDIPDYEKIKTDISLPHTNNANNKAHDLFKSLFKMPYKNIATVSTDDLEHLESEFGTEINAHGVEEEKGGMYNLLLMCISNQVRVPSSYWGFFVSGMPDISPVGHGPYYLIYSMPFVNKASIPGNNVNLSDVARILVPFSENKEILTDKLDAMVKVNLINPESKTMFINKLVTYQELLNDLKVHSKIKEIPDANNNHSFFNSTSLSPDPSRAEDIASASSFIYDIL
jgi:hypothetical protein